MCRSIQLLCLVGALLWVPAQLNAQPNDLEKLFGKGVHAFNAGQMQEAESLFDEAVAMGSRDPRVWYFRGVVRQAMGNTAAIGDFQTGAQLEYSATGRFFDIGRSLERIQGQVRLQIEDARRTARLSAKPPAAVDSNGNVVTRLPVVPDLVPGVRIILQTNLPDTSGKKYPNTPFADMPAPLNAPTQHKPQPAATNDPFPVEQAAPQPDQTSPTSDDPFGEEMPKEEPAGDKPGAKADDPFADNDKPMDEAGGNDDPFGNDDNASGGEGGDHENPFAEDGTGGVGSGDAGADDAGSGDDGGDDPFSDG